MAFSSTAGLLEVTNEAVRAVRAIGVAADTSIPTKADMAAAIAAGSAYATFVCYAASDGTTVTATNYYTVPLDTVANAVSGYSVSSGEVTLPNAGTYLVSYDVQVEWTTVNTKGHTEGVLQTDNSGSWAAVNGTKIALCQQGGSSITTYQRDAASCVVGIVTTTASNKKIRIYLGPSATAGSDYITLAHMCRLAVKRIA